MTSSCGVPPSRFIRIIVESLLNVRQDRSMAALLFEHLPFSVPVRLLPSAHPSTTTIGTPSWRAVAFCRPIADASSTTKRLPLCIKSDTLTLDGQADRLARIVDRRLAGLSRNGAEAGGLRTAKTATRGSPR